MPLSTDTMNSVNSSHIPKISRSSRRNRSYSDAHVHFASQTASVTDAFSNKSNGITYFNDNPTDGVATKEITAAASSPHQYSGNRPRSKSESEPCHHRRIPHKKKYPHHQHKQHQHHLNYGRHSPPPLSSCGKMWVRPMSARRGDVEAHHVITSALGDRHISSLTFSGGSSSSFCHPQAVSKLVPFANEEDAIAIDSSSTKKPMTPSTDSYTGVEDGLMMKYTSSSPSPPTLFGSGYTTSCSLLSHDSPTTPMAFGESGKPIVRAKNHHKDALFEEIGFLPTTTRQGGDVKWCEAE